MMRVVNLEQHERIKRRLHACGSSFSAVARDLSVSTSTVSIVSQGYQRSQRVEAGLALMLDTTPQALFPDRYLEEEGSSTQT